MKSLTFESVFRILVLLFSVAIVFLLALNHYETLQPIDYADHVDDVCAVIDGEEMTLSDLAFYVVYEETQIEKDAIIYDSENTRLFWHIRTNRSFVQTLGKESAMNMAIHDRIFYRAALKENMELSESDLESLESSKADFWEDLLDEQRSRLPVSAETIDETMRQIALANKYQWKLTEENETTYASFNYDGYDYKQMLNDHSVEIKKSLWNRVNVGDVTLVHD